MWKWACRLVFRTHPFFCMFGTMYAWTCLAVIRRLFLCTPRILDREWQYLRCAAVPGIWRANRIRVKWKQKFWGCQRGTWFYYPFEFGGSPFPEFRKPLGWAHVSQAIAQYVPIGSMYAIYGNIYHQYTPNVSIYTIHGSYGVWIYNSS